MSVPYGRPLTGSAGRVTALPRADTSSQATSVIAGRAWLIVPLLGALASRLWSTALLYVAAHDRHEPLFGAHGLTSTWDARWYLGIAADGYHRLPLQLNSIGGQHDYAFFPLWPLVIRAMSFLHVSPAIVAAALSPALFCVAAVLIAAALEPVFGRRVALDGTLLLAFSPAAWTFSMGYSEALFLVAAAIAFLPTSSGRRCVAVAVAALTRIAGVPLAVVSGLQYLRSRGRDVGALAVAAAGLGAFAAWWIVVAVISGDPLGFLHGSPDWGTVTGIWEVVKVVTQPQPELLGQLALMGLMLVGAGVAARYDWRMGAFAILSLALAFLPGGLVSSMPRYALAAFPAFAGLAALGGRRWTGLLIVGFAVAQALLVGLSFPLHGHGIAP